MWIIPLYYVIMCLGLNLPRLLTRFALCCLFVFRYINTHNWLLLTAAHGRRSSNLKSHFLSRFLFSLVDCCYCSLLWRRGTSWVLSEKRGLPVKGLISTKNSGEGFCKRDRQWKEFNQWWLSAFVGGVVVVVDVSLIIWWFVVGQQRRGWLVVAL
jgi:hypothetical protein